MSTRSHRNIMKHEHVFTQVIQTKTPKDRVLLVNYFRKIETVNSNGMPYAHDCVSLHLYSNVLMSQLFHY